VRQIFSEQVRALNPSRVDWLNTLPDADASRHLETCCGSRRWVLGMLERRPFKGVQHVLDVADQVWARLAAHDWKEAFSYHPKIGDVKSLREKFASTRAWTTGEQSGVHTASAETLKNLVEGNAQYEKNFGYIFIVCATGKSAEEMLRIQQTRLRNTAESELLIAAAEQSKITRLRLEKLLS